MYEQKLSFKSDGYGSDLNSVKVFAYLFHCFWKNSVVIHIYDSFLYAYHVEFQLVKQSMDVTVVFLVYFYELVYSNSDSDE